jgi:hypothetical protein
MKILVLDDIKFRHDVFDDMYPMDEVHHSYKFHDFVSRLNSGAPWGLLQLDHDLGDFVEDADFFRDGWGNIREFNGQHAVQAVCDLPDELLPKQVIVHSINPEGAKRMMSMLERRGIPCVWEPFGEIPTYDNQGNPIVVI